QRDAAIVSARAGTTRDVVEVHLDIAGYPVLLADTAGLREATDEIEEEGIRRALARAEAADLKIVLFDAAEKIDQESLSLLDARAIAVSSKSDAAHSTSRPGGFIPVSAKTGAGVPQLLQAITARLKDWMDTNPAPPLTRERHREALAQALQALQKAAQDA